MEHLRLFDTYAEYQQEKDNLAVPNISCCKDTPNKVYYYSDPLVCKFNVTSTSSPTKILNDPTAFLSIEVDGTILSSVTSGYTFGTTGEHTVKYVLNDNTLIKSGAFYQCPNLTSVVMPDSVRQRYRS